MMDTYACYLLAGIAAGVLLHEIWISYRRWSVRRAINKYIEWKD